MEQLPFAFEPPAVSAQTAVVAQNSMTGHKNADRISCASVGNSPDRLWFADLFRQVAVRQGGAARNLDHGLPDALLKRRAANVESNRVGPVLAGQHRVHLVHDAPHGIMILD